jgi:hypothetical protein
MRPAYRRTSWSLIVFPQEGHFILARKVRADSVGQAYALFTKSAKADLKSSAANGHLRDLISASLDYVSASSRVSELKSLVPRKSYFGFASLDIPEKLSRPVNARLFDPVITRKHLASLGESSFSRLSESTRERVLYTGAAAFCCANDLIRRDDRKTPGSFFEYYVGHLVSRALGVNPKNQIEVLNLDMQARLPTDLIFDLGPDKNKIHLPVKLSTRERVIQVWAHQRVLDGIYGTNRFKGVLVCLTETNLKRESAEVVEICLPDQWIIYQMFIAQLTRVYYLDPPIAYGRLADRYPFIRVTSFARFFDEQGVLTGADADV